MADLPALRSASSVIQDHLAKDATIIPDLADCLRTQGAHPSSLYSIFPDDTKVPFQKRKLVPLPESLFQHYNTTDITSYMGLFPDIQRAWISIDHKLFLWDYIDGQEMSSFMDQPDIISHTALVKPKPGMFIDDINWLLVICTPVSVLLIALSYTLNTLPGHKTKQSEIKLYSTDLSVQCDNPMTSAIGTSDGRIFMCGAHDGNLYEFHYQEGESWFGKRVQLINHSVGNVQSLLPRFATSVTTDHLSFIVNDPHRNCFYALANNSSISVYKLNGAKSVQHVQTLGNLCKSAQEKAPGTPALISDKFEVISLHPISPSESRSGVQLIAFTTNGVRLYFAPSMSYNFPYGGSYSQNPGSIQLVQVRLPPTDLLHPDEQVRNLRPSSYGPSQPPARRPYSLKALAYSCYRDGVTITTQAGDTQGTDFIIGLAPDLSRIGALGQYTQPQAHPPFGSNYSGQGTQYTPLVEYATVLSIPGNTWAIAPVPRAPLECPSGTPPPAVTNELATQFSEPPQQFMIFTHIGITFLTKRRTVDFVKAILDELRSHGSTQQLVEFRDSFGRDQTCAVLLGLACGNSFLDCLEGIPPVTLEVSNLANQAFYDFGERPIWSERTTLGQSDGQGTTIFSGRREGLALYLSRLLRPIWKSKMTKAGPAGKQLPVLLDTVLVTTQKDLALLKEFISNHPHLFRSSPADPTATRGPSPDQEAWKAENHSLVELQGVLVRTIEALSFVLLLYDYHFGDLINKCDAEVQRIVSNLTFEELITSQNGITVSRALVNVIIDQQIGQQISVDTVSEVLQQRCGSFCSTEDVMLYKAKENVRKAAESRNAAERQQLLSESLRLFTKGASIMEIEKLREIIGDYQHLRFVPGAISLPLVSAANIDRDNRGHDYWREGEPAGDPRAPLLERRTQCYDLILDSLQLFEAITEASPSEESIHGVAYELAFASDDEIFHSTLYDRLILRGLADQLLETRPTYLEAYLRRPPLHVDKYKLLWQFYVKNGQPLRAAEVLVALARSAEFNLELSERVEYLTLAVGNAKSHPVSVEGHYESAIAFLTELEETLEVAKVQLEIWSKFRAHKDDAPQVAERISNLEHRLLTITELYQDYAVTFQDPELKLLCLQVAEHHDDNILRPIWTEIFENCCEEPGQEVSWAENISREVGQIGKRFYPSESAFPLQHVASLLVRFSQQHKSVVSQGWAPRILVQCGVPHNEIWNVLHEMYECQVPPFNDQKNIQSLSADISVLLSDWMEYVLHPQMDARSDFPVARLDTAIDQYVKELDPKNVDTRTRYEATKHQLRRHW